MSAQHVSRRRIVIAAVLLSTIVVVGAVSFWPRAATEDQAIAGPGHSEHQPRAGEATPSADPSVAPDVPTTAGPETPLGSAPETSLLDAASAPTAGDAPRDTAALGAPRDAVDPSEVLDSEVFGGCLKQYGQTGQCLSVYPPSLAGHIQEMVDAGLDPATMPHNWTCDELGQYFPEGIVLRDAAVDPQELDTDADGVACEPDQAGATD